MRITIDFDTWDEMIAFTTSGKKTRTKKEEAADDAVSGGDLGLPAVGTPGAVIGTSGFTPPVQPMQGFPGSLPAAAPQAANPIVAQIIAKVDGALSSGQSPDNVLNWFRQQIGPDAAQATLDQIKTVFLPRMNDAQLKTLAPMFGITV